MKKILCTVIIIVMICFVGCSNSKVTEDEISKNSISEDIELVTAESVDFLNFDVVNMSNEGLQKHASAVYETLVELQDGKPVPCLAESWEVEGNEYTFHLKKGIKFSDGNNFDAQVVKLNIDSIIEYTYEQLTWLGFIEKLERVEVVDKYTVKFIFKHPYYWAIYDLTSSGILGMMSPGMFQEGKNPYEDAEYPIGTGPFELKIKERGKYYTFERREDYWRDKPEFNKYTVKIIGDLDARMMALKSGEIDFIVGVEKISSDAYNEFLKDDKFETKLSSNPVRTRNLVLNSAKGAAKDVRVRRALQHAVDKEAIAKNVFSGMEEKADYIMGRYLPFCDIDIVPYDYNKKKAEKLLEEAGWILPKGKNIREKEGKPLKIEIIYRSDFGSEQDMIQAIQGYFQEIGIDTKITAYEYMTWYGMGIEGKFDAIVNNTYGAPYDPYTYLGPMRNPTSIDYPAQAGLSKKKEIDIKIKEMFETVNEKEIQDTFSYVLNTLHDEAINIPITYMKEALIYNKEKIKDIDFAGMMDSTDVTKIIVKK